MLEKKVLIIPTQNLDPDVLAAVFSISRTISAKGKTRVEVLFNKKNIPTHLEKIFPFKDIRFTTEVEPQGFVVKLKSIDAKVKDIKWEEKDGEINLYLSAENGRLDRKASVRSGGTNYEKIILIGIEKLEDLEEIYAGNIDLFESVPLINIDTSSHNANYGNNTYVKPEASSVSEIAFNFLLEEGIEVGGKEATDLLSGIFWKTKSFQIGFNKSSTFQVCTDLINLNGDVSIALKQVYQTLNLVQIRLLAEILRNVEVSPDGIAWSLIRKNMLNSLKTSEITFPQINLISYLENTKLAFVLIEIEERKVHCDLRSNQKGIKASRIAAAFGSTGSSQQAIFTIPNTIENAKIQLINEIRGIDNSGLRRSESAKVSENFSTEREKATILPEGKKVFEQVDIDNTDFQNQKTPANNESQIQIAEKSTITSSIASVEAPERKDEKLYDPLPPASNTTAPPDSPPIDV
ncbi:hypothetical protein JW796_01930 [Candidatus Dojkabacteria bacterium]|nr:hypothetical protein [Candidatus Dojkabacteria bacterium]